MTRRRGVLIVLGAGMIAAPLAGFGQTPPRSPPYAQSPAKVHRIGVLSGGTPGATRQQFEAFERGLRELNYVDGKNVILDYRFAEGKFERLPALAAELIKRKPHVLVAHTTPGGLAARQATTEIPIVIVGIADPLGVGLVSSLARPVWNALSQRRSRRAQVQQSGWWIRCRPQPASAPPN